MAQMQDSVNVTRAEVATSPAASEATSPLATASPGSRNNPVERINAEVSSASSGDSTPAEPAEPALPSMAALRGAFESE